VTLIGDAAVSAWGFRLVQFQRICFAAFFVVSISLALAQAPTESGLAKPLPPGPMQAKIKAACTQCHNVGRITEQHLTAQQWSAQLDKMAGLGAEIPGSDRDNILKYLTKNFGPEKGAKSAVKKAGDGAK